MGSVTSRGGETYTGTTNTVYLVPGMYVLAFVIIYLNLLVLIVCAMAGGGVLVLSRQFLTVLRRGGIRLEVLMDSCIWAAKIVCGTFEKIIRFLST